LWCSLTPHSKMSNVTWTPKQIEALKLLSDPANDHTMLYGGARSGKTFLLVTAVIVRAMKYPGSRHLIARLRFAHAKLSLWLDTLPKALRAQVPADAYKANESDHYIRFANGSEIWIDGLDDKDRVDKILGREYATIYFNEVSQINYDTVTTVLTRLSQNVDGCRNVAYYDLNPSGKGHWANMLFIHGKLPTGDPAPSGYAYLRINPMDNRPNLPEGYIENFLAKLPESKRKRFLEGEWTDAEGVIFTDWDVVPEIPEEARLHSRRAYGLDFGFSVDPAAVVDLYMNGDDLWVDELVYDTQLTNQQLGMRMDGLVDKDIPIWADSAEPKSIEEIRRLGFTMIDGATKGPDSVDYGIDWLQTRHIHITERSMNLRNELENYTWRISQNGLATRKPIDDFNHAIDAMRYGCSGWMDQYRGELATTVTAAMLGL